MKNSGYSLTKGTNNGGTSYSLCRLTKHPQSSPVILSGWIWQLIQSQIEVSINFDQRAMTKNMDGFHRGSCPCTLPRKMILRFEWAEIWKVNDHSSLSILCATSLLVARALTVFVTFFWPNCSRLKFIIYVSAPLGRPFPSIPHSISIVFCSNFTIPRALASI